MFIDVDSALDLSNASNIVAFDKANSVITAIIENMLRNSILLKRRKVNSKEAHGVNDVNDGSKIKNDIYSIDIVLVAYVQAIVMMMEQNKSICRFHEKKNRGSEI